jgi:hypothetical protein
VKVIETFTATAQYGGMDNALLLPRRAGVRLSAKPSDIAALKSINSAPTTDAVSPSSASLVLSLSIELALTTFAPAARARAIIAEDHKI